MRVHAGLDKGRRNAALGLWQHAAVVICLSNRRAFEQAAARGEVRVGDLPEFNPGPGDHGQPAVSRASVCVSLSLLEVCPIQTYLGLPWRGNPAEGVPVGAVEQTCLQLI